MTSETRLPRYELDTLPDVAWPRLYVVHGLQGEVIRVELSRALWGHCIADAEKYCRQSGYTAKRQLADGLVGYFEEGE